MITKKTVLVLGAGASLGYGPPSGKELLQSIEHACNNFTPPNWMLDAARLMGRPIREYLIQAQGLATVIRESGVRSIDEILEHRSEFLPLGKVGITAWILPRETHDALFKKTVAERDESWYHYLWACLKTKKFEELSRNKLTILTYNYDRTLDVFLRAAMGSVYSQGPEQVESMMRYLPIVHLHGHLGSLVQVPFGKPAPDLGVGFQAAVNSIRIIHEEIDQKLFNFAHERLLDAEQVIFLGFGFHQANIERLITPDLTEVNKYGTAYDFTGEQIRLLNNKLKTCALENKKILPYLKDHCLLEN
jgi:hypothetical protein